MLGRHILSATPGRVPRCVPCRFMVGDRLFIVMEFLPCNLLELLEAQPGGMDRDAVRLIMFQLCSAIAFIHSKVRTTLCYVPRGL